MTCDEFTLSRSAFHQGVPSSPGRSTVLVYRDRIGARSEVHFLRRLYAGFERLSPVWLGCHLDGAAEALAAPTRLLGRSGFPGTIDRALFKQLGLLPPEPDLRALAPRVVHAHFGRGGALALPIARALNVPLVVTYHGGDAAKEKHYRRRLVPTIYQRRLKALQEQAAVIHCVSDHIKEVLLKRGFAAEKLVVIRYGIEPDETQPAESPLPPPYVLFVGRLVDKKGATYLIEAMRILKTQGCSIPLVLIGDGPLADQLKMQAKRTENVSFLGWRSNDEVRRWMGGATVFCVPSLTAASGDTEGLPNVMLEAMAVGAPVIGSRHAGISEAIEHGRNGLLVEPGNPLELARSIKALIDDPQARRRLGEAGRCTVKENFNAKVQSRLLEDVLCAAVEARGT